MLDTEKISAHQYRTLVIFFTIGTTIITVPTTMAAEAKQDGWIGAVLGVAVGLIIIWFYSKLGLLFPEKTFVEMHENLFGKWIGKMISLFFLSMSFLYGSELLFYVGKFISIQFFPEIPIAAINISMATIVIMSVRLGLETFTRSAEIFIVFFFILFIILTVFIAPQINLENLQPVFEVETKPLLRAVFFFVEFSTVTSVALLMIFPAFVNQPKAASKSFMIGYLIGGLVMIIVIFLTISVLGAESTARHNYPTYTLARKINIGNFVQRIEAVLAIMWILSIYMKMTIYLYAVVIGIAQILNLKNHRPLIVPLGGISVLLSLVMFSNVIEQQTWDQEIAVFFSYTVGFLLPLIMLCIAVFRKMVKVQNSSRK
ncbi:spore germination protein KB [Peribacillus simplex]|uniref:Spore germination protein KB n=1 Tax=Peribacillus simplex TaxID=1478 RepID=A0A9X8WGY9_9BACI|nr:endospore germination permease [Peribacillus simplex]SIQ06041.1 spore germination protein KB [Peribacillus simplex]